MSGLTFDMSDFERAARRVGALADQIPFALAQSLNDGAEAARLEMIETTWPSHVKVRDPRFLRAALTMKGSRASKKNLRVELYDKLGRASLVLHAKGGQKRPKGKSLAIPSREVGARRSGKGVPKGLRPRNISNSFIKGDVLYQRIGNGKDAKLKLMYTLKPSATIAGDVPFYSDFRRVMVREVQRAFISRILTAMANRKR